ncbi:MAG: metallophosphoesterase family protein [Planctomycetota bacterium]|jgi:hypothetical protein
MPFEALKFIHATGLLVDHQVRDVGSVSDEARPLIIDAALKSFERLMETAVDRDVDFVLLTGGTFVEDDRSLRARVAICDGLQCLSEAGIQVFVIPGPEDPAEAWHRISRLPDNVTIFDPMRDEPTAVMRDGQVIASLQGCSVWAQESAAVHSSDSHTMGQTRLGPLRVGIVPPEVLDGPLPGESTIEGWLERHRVDYLALPRPFDRLRVLRPEQVAFCPGGAVPVTSRETGIRGAALVSAEGRAAVNLSLFPASPLRRERFQLELDESTTWDQLIAVMRSAVEKLNGLGPVEVLLAAWQFDGVGDVLQSLRQEESQQELIELFDADGAVAPGTQIEHSFEVQVPSESGLMCDIPQADIDDAEENASIAGGFRRRLNGADSVVQQVMRRVHQSEGFPASAWTRRLDALATRVESENVAELTRELAGGWFAGETQTRAVKSHGVAGQTDTVASVESVASIDGAEFDDDAPDFDDPAAY